MKALFQRKFKVSLSLPKSYLIEPLLLFILAILSYGLLIHQLGFYWDDLPYLYVNHSQGVDGYPAYMASDRPFSAWFFILEVFLFGENPFCYHLFALFLHWGGAVIFFLILQKVFPFNKYLNFISAAFFLVYPGFLQQHVSLIYSLHLTVLVLFLLSVFFMLKSLENHSHYYLFMCLGLLCSLGIFSSEYFSFLELSRPFLVWIYIKGKKEKVENRSIFLIWLPYLTVFLIFLFWRIVIFQFPTYSPELFGLLKQNFISGITYMMNRIIRDFITVAFKAWIPIFTSISELILDFQNMVVWVCVFLISLTLILKHNQKNLLIRNHEETINSKKILTLGILFIFFAGIPIWATDLPVELEFAWDRLTLPFSLGVSLIITGAIGSIFIHSKFKITFFAVLLAMATCYQFINSKNFLDDWKSFNNFFQQLTWRVPGLVKGTTILTSKVNLKYYSDNSLTAPLNWIYDRKNHSSNLNYMFYFLEVRLGRRLPSLEKGIEINQPYRSFSFIGSTDNIILLNFKPPSCIHIIDNSNVDFYENNSDTSYKAALLTDQNLILPNPNYQLPSFFLKENKETWCFYFEKADLARQYKNWKEITYLANEAFEKNLEPSDPREYYPLIEAYAHESDFSTAVKYSRKVLQALPVAKKKLCDIWEISMKNIPFEKIDETTSHFYYSELKCGN